MKCAAERVVIRRFAHPDLAAPLRRVTQQRFGLTIALTLVFPDDQTREQLRQREVVAAEAAGIFRQRFASEHERRAHHLPWRLTREHPPSSTEVGPRAQPHMRRTSAGSRQSRCVRVPATCRYCREFCFDGYNVHSNVTEGEPGWIQS